MLTLTHQSGPDFAATAMREEDVPISTCHWLLTALAMTILAAPTAQAGAWAREEGTFFLSFGGNAALFGDAVRPVYYDPTVFLEYGLTPRLTIGIDGYTADRGDAGSLLGFARLAFDDGTGPDRFAASLSAGYTLLPNAEGVETLRAGLHWGRGLDDGWVAVDATATWLLDAGTQHKVDATWGHAFDERWTSVFTVEAGIGLTGDFYAKVTPSLVAEITPAISLRAGFVQALTGDHGGGLLVQSWITF